MWFDLDSFVTPTLLLALFLVGYLSLSQPHRAVVIGTGSDLVRFLLRRLESFRHRRPNSESNENRQTIQLDRGSRRCERVSYGENTGSEHMPTVSSPLSVCAGVVRPISSIEEEESDEDQFARLWPSIRISRYRRLVLPPDCRLLEKVARQRAHSTVTPSSNRQLKRGTHDQANDDDDHPLWRLRNYGMQLLYLLHSIWSYDYVRAFWTLFTWIQSFQKHQRRKGSVIPAVEDEDDDDASTSSKASGSTTNSFHSLVMQRKGGSGGGGSFRDSFVILGEEKKDDTSNSSSDLNAPNHIPRNESGSQRLETDKQPTAIPSKISVRQRQRSAGKRKDALESYRSPTTSKGVNTSISQMIMSSTSSPKRQSPAETTTASSSTRLSYNMAFFEAAPTEETLKQLSVEVPVPDRNGYTLGEDFLPSKKHTPLLVFVNSRSGPQKGHLLITQFRRLLNPIQVWDLADGGPEKVLESFSVFSRLRIMVCGGDGTVSWIISALEKMKLERWPPIAILPLGTGNDLARIHGWGGGYNNESLISILEQVAESYTSLLDRWEVKIVNRKGKVKEIKSCFNYLGVGVDAQAALQVHMLRESKPKLFFSRAVNKAWYAVFGAEDAIKASHANLTQEIKLIADGVEVPLPADTQGLLLLNIDSYAGGVTVWSRATKPSKSISSEIRQRSADGLVGLSSSAAAAAAASPYSSRRALSLGANLDSLEGWQQRQCSNDDMNHPLNRVDSTDDLSLTSLPRSDEDKLSRVTDCNMPSSCQDGMLDVVSFRGSVHLGQIRVGLSTAKRICQAREIKIELKKKVAVQIDGEPWRQNACTFHITRKKESALMLHRSPDESGGVEKEMAKLLDWAEETKLIDRSVHATMMKEYSKRIEKMNRQRREQSEDGNLMLALQRAMISKNPSSHHNLHSQGNGNVSSRPHHTYHGNISF